MSSEPSPAVPAVVVCGTVNIDTFVSVDRFPTAGETVIAGPNGKALGGKGANQAVAAARYAAGAGDVLFHATVGRDADGDSALAELAEYGVDVSAVGRSTPEHSAVETTGEELPTGQAFIMNDEDGENIIVVTSGANSVTDPEAFGSVAGSSGGSITSADEQVSVLLAQGELTPEHSAALPALAERLGARFVLNLAPVTTRDTDLLAAADPLIVNETEAADVLGLPGDTLLDEVLDAFVAAVDGGLARTALVTLGKQGALLVADGERTMIPSIPVEPADAVVDTTGAGDAFCGTFAAALAEGESLQSATNLATAAGSLAVRAQGAAASYAGRDEVRALTQTTEQMPPHEA